MAIILLPDRQREGVVGDQDKERETAGNLQPLSPSLRPPAPLTVEPIFGRQLFGTADTEKPKTQNEKCRRRCVAESESRGGGHTRKHIKIFNYHVNLRLLFLLLF